MTCCPAPWPPLRSTCSDQPTSPTTCPRWVSPASRPLRCCSSQPGAWPTANSEEDPVMPRSPSAWDQRSMSSTAVAAGFLGTGYVALQLLGRRAGSTAKERATVLPGDELVPRPQLLTDHAATIGAPPTAVWPWLTQMGWHLGG